MSVLSPPTVTGYVHNLLAKVHWKKWKNPDAGFYYSRAIPTLLEGNDCVREKALSRLMTTPSTSFVLLQEATEETVWFMNFLNIKGCMYHVIGPSELEREGHESFPLVVLRCDIWEETDVIRIALPHGSGEFVAVTAKHVPTNQKCGFVSVHATYGPENRWVEKEISEIVSSIENIPWVIGGDFNTKTPSYLGENVVKSVLPPGSVTHYSNTSQTNRMVEYDHVFTRGLANVRTYVNAPDSPSKYLSHGWGKTELGSRDLAKYHSDHAILRVAFDL